MAVKYRIPQPLGSNLVVRLDPPEEVTEGGIVLAGTPDGELGPFRATVVAVGPGTLLSSGDYAPPGVGVGDRVLLTRQGQEIKVGETLNVVMEREVLVKL